MTDLAPIVRLARLAEALEAGVLLPAAEALSLAGDLKRYLQGGVELDVALGLKPSAGERSLTTRFAMVDRDERLRAAADRWFPGRSDSDAAEELGTALSRFWATAWRSCRTDEVCPPRYAGNIRADLWAILKARPYPLKARSIRAVLAMSSAYSLPTVAGTVRQVDV
jgi:hypothetical protein